MRRRTGIVALVIGALVVAGLPGPTQAEHAEYPGSIDLTVGPLVSGTQAYVDGTFVWTDYAYDDQQGFNPAYPSSIDGGNAADLIQLQLSVTPEGDLRIRAILQTLTDPDLPLLGVGFDTDNDPATGARTVPGGRWNVQNRLGLDAFVSVSSAGGRLWRATSDAWEVVSSFDASVDTASNSMTTVVPRSELDPGTDTWHAVGMLGLASPSFVEGAGEIYDLAFVVGEPPGFWVGQTWQEVDQRLVVNGNRSERFGVAEVDFGKLARGESDLPVLTPGYHTLLYYSNLDLGQGIRPMATQGFESLRSTDLVYAGPYQPYVVHVPEGVSGPLPAIVWLHGRGGNHMEGAQASFRDFRPPAVIILPLGRGPHVGYGGTDIFGFVNDISVLGERDVVDVLADAKRRLPIDPDRVVISGFSMGGVGAFHIAEFYPDLFTGMLSLGGGDFAIIPINHLRPRLLGNLYNLPVRAANGALDPLAHYPAWEEATLTLDLMGDIDYRAYLALRRAHEVYTPLVDCVFGELIDHPRVVDPPRVVYTVNPAFEVDDPHRHLTVRHTGAYWVSELELREPEARNLTAGGQELDQSQNATIDVTTLARADRAHEHFPVAGAGQNITSGADFCGPNPAVRTNDAWRIRGMERSQAPAQPVSNGLEVETTKLSHAALELPRMGIATDEPITVTVAGDGGSTLTLLGPWRAGTEVEVTKQRNDVLGIAAGPETSTIHADHGALRLSDDFSGTHTYVLTPSVPDFLEISIDVKPGDEENTVNPNSQGTIPVALLSDEDFDATTTDATTLTFGRTGDEDSLARQGPSGTPRCSAGDANGDGSLDLVCHFRVQAAGFQEGDDEAVLRGQTTSGHRFEGREKITLVG